MDGTGSGRCVHFLRIVDSSRARGTFLYVGRSDLPLVVLFDANARVGSVASLAVGDQVVDWEDTAGAEFHALLWEWDLCLHATLPGPHNDPAKPSGTWCSRTWWHGIDFVAVPRDWLAGVKRAEVETAGALPGSGFFDRAMPIVEVSFRLRRQVTSAQGVLTHLAWLCGDLRFASRSSFSRLPLLLFLRSFRWMSTPGYWQRLPRCLGDVRLLGYKLRHRRIGWTRRLGERSALMLWQEEHTKRPAGYSPEPGSRRFSRSGGMQ